MTKFYADSERPPSFESADFSKLEAITEDSQEDSACSSGASSASDAMANGIRFSLGSGENIVQDNETSEGEDVFIPPALNHFRFKQQKISEASPGRDYQDFLKLSAVLISGGLRRQLTVNPLEDKKMYDHFNEHIQDVVTKGHTKVPKLFVQLNELYLPDSPDGEMQWWETARWMKYEEDVETGAERWGKPRVASLSFHSLLELRHFIQNGCVLLGVQADSLADLSRALVDQMVMQNRMSKEDAQLIVRAILLSHSKVQDRMHAPHSDTKTHAAYNSLGNCFYRQQKFAPPITRPAFNRTKSARIVHAHSGRHATIAERSYSTADVLHTDKSAPANMIRNRCNSIARSSSLAFKILSSAKLEHLNDETLKASKVPLQDDCHKLKPPSPIKIDIPPKEPVRKSARRSLLNPYKLVHFVLHKLKKKPKGEKKPTEDQDLKRRIPEGTEGGVILVGAVDFLPGVVMSFVRLEQPLELPHITDVVIPVRFIVLLLGPLSAGIDFHELGRSVSTLLASRSFQEIAYRASHVKELLMGIHHFLDLSIVIPPGHWNPALMIQEQIHVKANWLDAANRHRLQKAFSTASTDTTATNNDPHNPGHAEQKEHGGIHDPLPRTGRLFGRMMKEVQTRYPLYWSDIKDGCNLHCFRSILFICFACCIPAVTFGNILYTKTHGYMGIKETLLSTGLCGTVFSLCSCQPMLIMGLTGPMLIYEQALFTFFGGSHFFAGRIWVSLWCALFCVLLVAFDGASLIRYFSRFTDDIIETMVSIVFISQCVIFIKKVHSNTVCQLYFIMLMALFVADKHPVWRLDNYCAQKNICSYPEIIQNRDVDYNKSSFVEPNIAVLSTCLAIATFLLASVFSKLRNSHYFGRQMRRTIGDFGITLSVLIIVTLDVVLLEDHFTEKVHMDNNMSPTHASRRGWWVNPWPVPFWVIGLSLIGGLLLFTVIFIETQLVQVMLQRKEYGLRKGGGNHFDMLITTALVLVCSFLGLPFLCAAVVATSSHLKSVTEYKLGAPGESPKVKRVLEQRITALFISLIIGVSVLATPVLKMIPKSVLFGVFLYLGIMTLQGVQLFQRSILYFIPVKYHPPLIYTLRTRTSRMNLYTGIQLTLFLFVLSVKTVKAIAFLFPLTILCCILVRWFVLPKIFTLNELSALDYHNEEVNQDTDFYSNSHRLQSFQRPGDD